MPGGEEAGTFRRPVRDAAMPAAPKRETICKWGRGLDQAHWPVNPRCRAGSAWRLLSTPILALRLGNKVDGQVSGLRRASAMLITCGSGKEWRAGGSRAQAASANCQGV